jgi:hypothetical protein
MKIRILAILSGSMVVSPSVLIVAATPRLLFNDLKLL